MNSEEQQIDYERVINHWIDTSETDYELMLDVFERRYYSWSLFHGHIVLERLLKALYVKEHHRHAPFTHNLYRLTELTEIDVPEDYSDWLVTVTSFNINARYDDYRKEFYNRCTLEYTTLWIERIKRLRIWIKDKL